ncbi:hypothetical protein [Algoriphagus aquimarinus]|uniref:DUF6932 family protein n=1 Tax=Algoriphagus aquimarinus TaxID=237018 RepID=UPI0030D85AE7|tara:strand:+ start:13164 stop:13598 length:435 start_codon:yes stop_codon:yes gene_type:complete
MGILFDKNGNLPKGIHLMTLENFELQFGYNDRRRKLIEGLKEGIKNLKDCGCITIYIDGSFVTKKENPGDFDACWDHEGVDLSKLKNRYPVLLDFSNSRRNQKDKYGGEFFLAKREAAPFAIFLDFFQTDRNGFSKGIVQINLS